MTMATDSRRLTVGSLFAGIGGFDLGFERAGFEIKWQVEIDPFCRKVLEKHWPQVRRYEDVRTVGDELERVDVICGGFPCQDISNEGYRVGIDGERSGLWREMSRLVGSIRPRFVVVENVAALLDRGMGRVLGDLAGMGYDSEWGVFRACAFGASHMRERVFIVAYPQGERQHAGRFRSGLAERSAESHDDDSITVWPRPDESGVRGIAHGIPGRPHRMRGLGNAIVPQIAQWIAERIKEAEGLNYGE